MLHLGDRLANCELYLPELKCRDVAIDASEVVLDPLQEVVNAEVKAKHPSTSLAELMWSKVKSG